ncbi:MAG TPA: hypothetical protein PKY71_05305 [Smithellaceae bacterium]|nr:hypothetical protein [Smithellaceae bacterium]
MTVQKNKSVKSNAERVTKQHIMVHPELNADERFYNKTKFHHLLHVEKTRSERAQKPLILMIIDISSLMKEQHAHDLQKQIKSVLETSLTDSDIRGWYNYNEKIGIIFSGVTSADSRQIGTILKKINDNLSKRMDDGLSNQINIFFHIYPKM